MTFRSRIATCQFSPAARSRAWTRRRLQTAVKPSSSRPLRMYRARVRFILHYQTTPLARLECPKVQATQHATVLCPGKPCYRNLRISPALLKEYPAVLTFLLFKAHLRVKAARIVFKPFPRPSLEQQHRRHERSSVHNKFRPIRRVPDNLDRPCAVAMTTASNPAIITRSQDTDFVPRPLTVLSGLGEYRDVRIVISG